jgi:hypothetical protein
LAAVLRDGLITRLEIWKSADQFPISIRRRHDAGELDNAVDVEQIDEFAEDLEPVALGKTEETRIPQINIVLRRGFSGITFDADGSVRIGNTCTEDAVTIEANKKTFAEEFTRRAEFRSLYDPLSNSDYVERLFQATGINVSAQEKQSLVDGLNNQTETRASVLQKVVDGAVS